MLACVVTKDFDSDWVNVGTYRVQVHDKKTVGLDMVPGKHGAIQYEKYMKAGKPFPVAIVCGCDPLGYLVSGIEVDLDLGAVRLSHLDLVDACAVTVLALDLEHRAPDGVERRRGSSLPLLPGHSFLGFTAHRLRDAGARGGERHDGHDGESSNLAIDPHRFSSFHRPSR